MTKPLLNIPQLADLLGLERSWVEDKVTARALPHHRLGKHVRFTEDDIEEIISSSAVQPSGRRAPSRDDVAVQRMRLGRAARQSKDRAA